MVKIGAHLKVKKGRQFV